MSQILWTIQTQSGRQNVHSYVLFPFVFGTGGHGIPDNSLLLISLLVCLYNPSNFRSTSEDTISYCPPRLVYTSSSFWSSSFNINSTENFLLIFNWCTSFLTFVRSVSLGAYVSRTLSDRINSVPLFRSNRPPVYRQIVYPLPSIWFNLVNPKTADKSPITLSWITSVSQNSSFQCTTFKVNCFL